MKKIFTIGMIITFLISLASVLGQSVPCPVSGKITTVPLQASVGLKVVVQTLTGSILDSTVSNEYGEYIMDIGHKISCTPGTRYKVVIEDCDGDSACSRIGTVRYGGIRLDFDLSHVPLDYECPVCPTVPTYPTCPTYVTTVCPTTIPTTTTSIKVTPCPEPEDCPKCPDVGERTWVDRLMGLVGGLLLGIGGAVGYRFTISKTKTGKLSLRLTGHRHVGYNRMHPHWQEHKKHWHPPGCLDPMYDDKGKYIGCREWSSESWKKKYEEERDE